MILKFIAAAAIVAIPAAVHAQATTPTTTSPTPTYPQDTTRSTTRIHTDSTKVDSANGSVITDSTSIHKKNDRIRDTTTAGKIPSSRVHTDSTRVHTDSTMNMPPADTTKMGPPKPSSPTPPR
jgi:hypothetical protein